MSRSSGNRPAKRRATAAALLSCALSVSGVALVARIPVSAFLPSVARKTSFSHILGAGTEVSRLRQRCRVIERSNRGYEGSGSGGGDVCGDGLGCRRRGRDSRVGSRSYGITTTSMVFDLFNPQSRSKVSQCKRCGVGRAALRVCNAR